jgi:hypothetical protein
MDSGTASSSLIGNAGSTDLVPETMAVLDEFRILADAAARLVARGDALCDDWRRVGDDDPGDRALVDELAGWAERATALTGPASYRPADAATAVFGNPLPGYFVG